MPVNSMLYITWSLDSFAGVVGKNSGLLFFVQITMTKFKFYGNWVAATPEIFHIVNIIMIKLS